MNPDVFRLKDECFEDSENLPQPDVLAQEIADDPSTAFHDPVESKYSGNLETQLKLEVVTVQPQSFRPLDSPPRNPDADRSSLTSIQTDHAFPFQALAEVA